MYFQQLPRRVVILALNPFNENHYWRLNHAMVLKNMFIIRGKSDDTTVQVKLDQLKRKKYENLDK